MDGQSRDCWGFIPGANWGRWGWVLVIAVCSLTADFVRAQEAQWIWTGDHKKEAVPKGATCHFRKQFNVKSPEAAVVAIFADDNYELYLNGRKVGNGESPKKLTEYDVSKYVVRGNNILAVKVANRAGKTAALVCRVTVKEKNADWVSYSSDETWKANTRPLPLWNTAIYNDRAWEGAQVFGVLGETAPWDLRDEQAGPPAKTSQTDIVATRDPLLETQPVGTGVKAPASVEPGSTGTETPETQEDEFKEPVAATLAKSTRFESNDEFEVQQVIPGDQTGSLIAMTFNEFGHILAAKEGGPLLLIYDSNNDRIPDKTRIYCEKVKNCQGILALNGDVLVTAEGPDGPGLYRLSDKNRDGVLEDIRTLVKFKCESAEHGAHGLVLGPDGLIYVLLGNYASVDGQIDPASPHRDYYEGDLLSPRYEDPAGHAVGIKAPGGTVIRTDAEGTGVQIVCGGLRNPYDLTFNGDGELFVHDADMESDEGLSWYRPTRLLHLIPGGEYGWRSGWATWPEYYADSLPASLDTGRGSPTGIVSYNHFMFPLRFQGCLFTADWSQGKIVAVRLKKNGAGYTATAETFVEGNPLNVTDLDVGPDGWLYFVTGGRGTGGGLYRVVWKGVVPPQIANVGTGLTAVIRQPQIHSSWARQNIAGLKKQVGEKWDSSLIGVAKSNANPPQYRLQALNLMQLYGPTPSTELLLTLSKQPNEQVRAKAAELMGLHPDEKTQQRLVEMLTDTDRAVRRKACEALSRADQAPPLEDLQPLLASDDRFEAWAARRVLERMKVEDWRESLLASEDHRVMVQGGLALLTAYPERQNALDVLNRIEQSLGKFISDRDFLDMLRLTEVALARGEIKAEDVPDLKKKLADEFPAGDPLMNRELARLLVYLQETTITDRYLAYLKSDVADVDKLHLAIHLRFLESGWTPEQRMELLQFYEAANSQKGGGSYARYVINATRDFTKQFDEEEAKLVLQQGSQLPNAALGALYRLPEKLDPQTLTMLQELDERIAGKTGDSIQRLQVGIVAVLARSGEPDAFAYLRKVWDSSPERRQPIALGLAQSPAGENWSYIVRSLQYMEPQAARDVCVKLMEVQQAPEEPELYRAVILLGLKAKEKEKGADAPLALLQFWTGEDLAKDESEEKQLSAWQEWFAKQYPDQPPAELPVAAENAKYTMEQLQTYLSGEEFASADPARGESVFVKAQCIKCHRFNDKGESLGPDLTTLSKRFTKKEILESIIYPSHVISSQYAAKTVQTTDGNTLTGIVAPGAAGETVILQANGEKVTLKDEEITETKVSPISAMPAGTLDTLTLDEIGDLFAYMQGTVKQPSITRKPLPAGMK